MLAALAFCGCAAGNHSRQVVYRPTALSVTTGATAQVTLAQAQALDQLDQEHAVDLYYQAAVLAAQGLQQYPTPGTCNGQGEEVYQQALSGLIDAGQRYGRLDPRRQLIIVEGGTRVVPIRYFGFAWRPQDFSRLTSVDGHESGDIAHHFASPGLGVPLLGEWIAPCPQETFLPRWEPFAVTAVLRPATDVVGQSSAIPCDEHVLDLFNPLVFDTLSWGGASRPLARDLTAPLAAIVNEVPRQYLRGFTAPNDTAVQPKLVMVEPYQRGKIPVVFIHGLYSDPITWVDMENELRVQRDLYDHYQFWMFRYPTGGEVLDSAAALRHSLQSARDTFDPQHTDPALDEMVLVGHSLGGLLSKMQVTSSYDLLWREVAWQPFDALRAPSESQMRLARGFFFEPAPTIKRVIFIGTPHRGSGIAWRLAGRLGSALVSFGSQEKAAYRQLIDDNRDVFKESVERRQPTTIDLLEPQSPFLAALERMPVNCETHLHSIIGTGGVNVLGEPGDGVVTVSSARHCGDSELLVAAKHEMLQRDPASISEVARILRLHAEGVHQETVASVAP